MPPDVPQDRQLAAAQAALDHTTRRYADATTAMHAARADYTRARQQDPAGQTTDQARNASTEAEHDQIDARAAMEQARDELIAVHRQSAAYAVTGEAAADV